MFWPTFYSGLTRSCLGGGDGDELETSEAYGLNMFLRKVPFRLLGIPYSTS